MHRIIGLASFMVGVGFGLYAVVVTLPQSLLLIVSAFFIGVASLVGREIPPPGTPVERDGNRRDGTVPPDAEDAMEVRYIGDDVPGRDKP